MELHKYTSEKPKSDHPQGGLFLSTEFSIPPFVQELVSSIDALRARSQEAKRELVEVQAGWQATQATGVWQSYGKTLERFVSVDSELDPFISRTVCRMEGLHAAATAYDDACSTIRSVAVDLSRELTEHQPDSTPFCLGNNSYGLVAGPFDRKYLAIYDTSGDSVALFDCESETGNSSQRLAGVLDYQALLLDALTLGSDPAN